MCERHVGLQVILLDGHGVCLLVRLVLSDMPRWQLLLVAPQVSVCVCLKNEMKTNV